MNGSAITILLSYAGHCKHSKVTQERVRVFETPDETRGLGLVFMFIHCHSYAVTESLPDDIYCALDKAISFVVGDVLIALSLMHKLFHVESSILLKFIEEFLRQGSRLIRRKDVASHTEQPVLALTFIEECSKQRNLSIRAVALEVHRRILIRPILYRAWFVIYKNCLCNRHLIPIIHTLVIALCFQVWGEDLNL